MIDVLGVHFEGYLWYFLFVLVVVLQKRMMNRSTEVTETVEEGSTFGVSLLHSRTQALTGIQAHKHLSAMLGQAFFITLLIVKCWPTASVGILIEGPKHPSADWSKLPETLIHWHLTLTDSTHISKSVLLLFFEVSANIVATADSVI